MKLTLKTTIETKTTTYSDDGNANSTTNTTNKYENSIGVPFTVKRDSVEYYGTLYYYTDDVKTHINNTPIDLSTNSIEKLDSKLQVSSYEELLEIDENKVVWRRYEQGYYTLLDGTILDTCYEYNYTNAPFSQKALCGIDNLRSLAERLKLRDDVLQVTVEEIPYYNQSEDNVFYIKMIVRIPAQFIKECLNTKHTPRRAYIKYILDLTCPNNEYYYP